MNPTKEDCKYWDKCYQKNEAHLTKYNHPQKFDEREEKETTGKKRKHPEENNTETKNPPVSETGCSSNDFERKEMDITKEYNEVMKNLEGKNFFEIFERRVVLSAKAEYLNLLKTNEFIRYKFLVEMPSDFYEFWEFSKSLKPDSPEDAFKSIGLLLVGPFDFLAGKFHEAPIFEPGDYLRHWRFYYDPPEFQTIFVKQNSTIHYGYWRDTPKDNDKLLLATNDSSKSSEFKFIAANAFDVLEYYLNNDFNKTPFNQANVNKILKQMLAYLEDKNIIKNNFDEIKKLRDKQVVAKTFHKAGIVVPYDKQKQIGYRTLLESDSTIKKYLLKLENDGSMDGVLEKLQPILSAASIAADECDFGTSLELGLDLFASGYNQLHDIVLSLLIPAYNLLQRPQYIAIMKTHLHSRKHGFNLSVFSKE